MHLYHQQFFRRQIQPWELRERGFLVARPHVSPKQATRLLHRIAGNAKFVGECNVWRFGRCLQNLPGMAYFPPVIKATQTARFVSPVGQRGTAMWARLREEAADPIRIPRAFFELNESKGIPILSRV